MQTAVDSVLPFFTVVSLTASAGSASGEAQPRSATGTIAADVDNCPNGGTRTEDDQLTTILVTLAACRFSDPQLGSFQFDGTINVALVAGTVAFDVTTRDLANDRIVTFIGSVSGTPRSGGGFVVNGGPIVITTPQGKFTLTANAFTVDGDGNVVSGAGTAEDTDDNFDLESIRVTVQAGGTNADVLATFDDASTATFVLNLKTGDLTPTS